MRLEQSLSSSVVSLIERRPSTASDEVTSIVNTFAFPVQVSKQLIDNILFDIAFNCKRALYSLRQPDQSTFSVTIDSTSSVVSKEKVRFIVYQRGHCLSTLLVHFIDHPLLLAEFCARP